MRKAKQDRLEKKGWKAGSVDEFLDLSPEESAYIEVKLRLSDNLRKRRTRKKLSQKQLATLIKSSQSRVAKMEGGDPTVSLDLLVKTLFVLGASDRDLANVIAARTHSPSG
jgi:predicted XRE-type DNA-binding protein